MADTRPLPPETPANNNLIAHTPQDKLTQRQRDYANLYGVPLLVPPRSTDPNPRNANGPNAPGGTSYVGSPEHTGPVDVPTGYVPPAPTSAGYPFPTGNTPPPGDATTTPVTGPVFGGPPVSEHWTDSDGTVHWGSSPPTTTTTPTTTVDPSAAAAAAAAKLAKDAANRDAFASIKAVLGQYGLESLSDFAWQEIISGRSGNEVLQDIRETPQFHQRFPAIFDRIKNGLPPLSPGDYVSYENTATQYMRDAGLPKGFYDSPEDFTKFLSNDVSLKELGERVNLAKDAAYNAPTEVRSALRGQFGLGDGDLAAFFLDPNRAQPLLQRTYHAAQIAGAGTRTGYDTNAEQDYRLADLGVSDQQAQAGFSTLQQSRELFNPLTGHSNEGAITTDQQLGAAFGGNAADQQLIERRRQQRQAEFQDGGAFAAGQSGVSGLGSAQK